jgi:hypothetical protein
VQTSAGAIEGSGSDSSIVETLPTSLLGEAPRSGHDSEAVAPLYGTTVIPYAVAGCDCNTITVSSTKGNETSGTAKTSSADNSEASLSTRDSH